MGERPERMSAAVLQGPGALAVQEVPVPALGADDVLVAIDLCGVCGSDLHMVLEGWGEAGSWQGHEWIGRVAAVGDAVTRWQPGDEVVGGPSVRCGTCAMCRAGRPSLCADRDTPGIGPEQGAFATYKVTPADELLALPVGLDPRAAALAEPLAVALHGVHQGQAAPGQRVLVMGAGPIGALEHRRAPRPRAWTTSAAPSPARPAVRSPKRSAPPGSSTRAISRCPRSPIPAASSTTPSTSCSSAPASARAMEAGLAQLVRGGTLVLVGAGIEAPRFDPNRILLNELRITGAFTYDAGGFEQALALLGSDDFPVDALLEPGEVGLPDLLEAMQDLAAGRRAGKVLVRP